MNWEAIGAIGEVVGAAALLFVLAQVRQARKDSRRALGQGRSEAARDTLALQLDERTNRLLVKADAAFGAPRSPFVSAVMDQAGLTEDDASHLSWTLHSWWVYRLQIIPNVDDLTAIERASFDGAIRGTYGRPGVFRLFYETVLNPTAHPDALRYIERVLAQPR